MKNTIFTGMCTALVTPMTSDGSIDYASFGRFIEFQIENGINALVVMGTTGENATIEYSEQKEIVRFVVERPPVAFPSLPAPAPTTPSTSFPIPRPPAKWAPTRFWS